MKALARVGFLAVLGFANISSAQTLLCGRTTGSAIDMQIRLSFEDNGAEGESGNGSIDIQNDSAHRQGNASEARNIDFATMQIRVQLQDAQGVPLQETTPRSDGKVTLRVCSRSAYRVRVTGADIEESVADDVQPGRGDRIMTMVLHHKGNNQKSKPGKGTISVNRLRVPKKAQKELEQGNRALAKGKLEDAKRDFERAIEFYPAYDQAYNNLGVVLMQTGDRETGQQAFEKAVALNDHFAHAYLNLAKIAIDDKQYAKACDLARKSLSSEPLNPGALFVAAEASFFTHSFSDTVTYTRTLHTLPHEKFALAHFLSGKGLEAQNLPAQALAEYELFLKEDPSDSNAPKALEAIRVLRSSGLAQQ